MNKNKILAFGLIGYGLAQTTGFFNKKDPNNDGGIPNNDGGVFPNGDVIITQPINEEDVKIAERSTLQPLKPIIQPKIDYLNFKRKDWINLLLYYQQQTGGSLYEAAVSAFFLWYNNNNPYKNQYTSPMAFLIGNILTSPLKQKKTNQHSIGIINVEWDSVPIYDTYSNSQNNVTPWTCTNWKVWHQKLEQHYNSTYIANQIWEQAWNDQQNSCWFLGAIGCPDSSYCRYECDFVEYLYSKDIAVGNLFSNSYCSLSNVVKNIVGSIEDVSKGISNTAKIAQFGIPIAAAAIAYSYVKKQQK